VSVDPAVFLVSVLGFEFQVYFSPVVTRETAVPPLAAAKLE